MAFLPVLGTLAGVAGAITTGNAQAQAANYQGQVASNNALIARQNAAHAAQSSSVNTEAAGIKAAQQDAGVKAAGAANNLDVSTGSPTVVQEAQHGIGALDVANTANKGAEAVYGYQTQATGFRAQSELDKAQAPGDELAGFLKAGSLIGNAAPNLSSSFAWMGGNKGGNAGAESEASTYGNWDN